MSVKSRVDRLGGAVAGAAENCTCGPSDMRVRYEGEPEDLSPAKECARCGRPREVVRLHVVYQERARP